MVRDKNGDIQVGSMIIVGFQWLWNLITTPLKRVWEFICEACDDGLMFPMFLAVCVVGIVTIAVAPGEDHSEGVKAVTTKSFKSMSARFDPGGSLMFKLILTNKQCESELKHVPSLNKPFDEVSGYFGIVMEDTHQIGVACWSPVDADGKDVRFKIRLLVPNTFIERQSIEAQKSYYGSQELTWIKPSSDFTYR